MVDNDTGVHFCSRFIPTMSLFLFIIIWATGETITLDGTIIMFTGFLLVTVPFYFLAYGWYHIAKRTFSQGIKFHGVVTKTNVSPVAHAIQGPFHIYYQYEVDGKKVESYNNFRGKSKARDLAVVGKEITVMRSKFGGFSFIRDVYEDDAEQVES